MDTSDDAVTFVSGITAAVPSEHAVVVSADVKPLAELDNPSRWYVPPGGLVFCVDELAGKPEDVEPVLRQRAAAFPKVTAYLDGTGSGGPSAEAERLVYVFGVAPDGTGVSGEVVQTHKQSYSRISVQVSGTCTVAAADAHDFVYGDLVCARLDTAELGFKEADDHFKTGKLVPWEMRPRKEAWYDCPDKVVVWNLCKGLESLKRCEGVDNFFNSGTPNVKLNDCWSNATWKLLLDHFNSKYETVYAGLTTIEDLKAVAFDRHVNVVFNFNEKKIDDLSSQNIVVPGIFNLVNFVDDLDDARNLAASSNVDDLWNAFRSEIDSQNGNPLKLAMPIGFEAAVWNNVAIEKDLFDEGSDLPPPVGTLAADSVSSGTFVSAAGDSDELKKASSGLWFYKALFIEASLRGPLSIEPALAADTDGDQITNLVDDAIKLLKSNDDRTYTKAAVKWSGNTTLPFGRVLEVSWFMPPRLLFVAVTNPPPRSAPTNLGSSYCRSCLCQVHISRSEPPSIKFCARQ